MRELLILMILWSSFMLGFVVCEKYMEKRGYEKVIDYSTMNRIAFLFSGD